VTDTGLEHYSGRRVLVIGGAGAIGSNLVRSLVELEAEVIVLDDLTSGYRWNLPDHPRLMLIEGDLLDDTMLKRVFAERPSVAFHLAAFFANQNSVDHPERDLMVNGLGTLRILQYAALVGLERLVFTSSSSIYGDNAPFPVDESNVATTLSTPYQVTKLLGELYGNFYRKHHDVPFVAVRLFNSFGPGEVPGQYRNVIPNFMYWAMTGRPLPVTGTGDETRDFTFVQDVVWALLECGRNPNAIGEVFNIAGGLEYPIRDVARLIIETTGSASTIEYRPQRKWDGKKRFRADTTHARAVLGFEPRADFAAGIARTHSWFVENFDEIQAAASFGPGQSAALRR
jgi:nucleoside-diphosphate-sugar epimerase